MSGGKSVRKGIHHPEEERGDDEVLPDAERRRLVKRLAVTGIALPAAFTIS